MEPTELRISVTREGSVRFGVRAQPRARVSRLCTLRQGELVVQLAASPVDGEANAELVTLLARIFSIPKRDVEVVRGDSSRSKLIEIRGVALDEARRRIASAME